MRRLETCSRRTVSADQEKNSEPTMNASLSLSRAGFIMQLERRLPKGASFGVVEVTILKTTDAVDRAANQAVRPDLGTKDGVKSVRVGFTDQR